MGILKMESEAAFNRAMVASELDIDDPLSKGFSNVIKGIKEGIMTKEQGLNQMAKYAYDNLSYKKKDGSSGFLRDAYGGQYDEIKKVKKQSK